MTVAQIKDSLPPVLVRYNGELWTARVTGRLNQFASVSPHTRVRGGRVDVIIGHVFHFSWESVARAVNDGHVLTCD